jgi:hypothetical protein
MHMTEAHVQPSLTKHAHVHPSLTKHAHVHPSLTKHAHVHPSPTKHAHMHPSLTKHAHVHPSLTCDSFDAVKFPLAMVTSVLNLTRSVAVSSGVSHSVSPVASQKKYLWRARW